MAYSADLLSDDEEIIREFRPHWKMLAIPFFWIIVGIAIIIAAWSVIPPDDNALVDWIITGVVVLLLIPLAFSPVVAWWFTHYILTNERLITRSGVIARSGIEMPLENITNVLFSQNVFERVLRFGDLLIESAGETGQSRFADIPDPQEFQALLYRIREARTNLLAGLEAPVSAADAGPEERIAKLAKLRDDGAITQEEFEEKKAKLLDEI